jgi:hypothetical protein
LSGVFYFKVDKTDRLVLILATNLKTDRNVSVLLGDRMEVTLTLRES